MGMWSGDMGWGHGMGTRDGDMGWGHGVGTWGHRVGTQGGDTGWGHGDMGRGHGLLGSLTGVVLLCKGHDVNPINVVLLGGVMGW